MRNLHLICTLALFAGCGVRMNTVIKERDERVKDYLDRTIGKSIFPGIQYVVTDSSGRIFEYDGGLADISNGIPMRSGTTMMAYSMTKTFTAVAVLRLVDAGVIGLDDSVFKYVDYTPYGRSMTVRHLLAQMSGIPNPIPLRWAHPAAQHASFSEESALKKVLQENPDPDFSPGTKYAYSNISYWFLGKIIEKTTGVPYEEYMRQNVFAPLGLAPRDAAFTIVSDAPHAKGYLDKYSWMNILKGFLVDKELVGEYEGAWLNIRDHHLNGPAFGGLIGTARGVGVFLQDQLRTHSVLLSPGTEQLFYTQQKTTSGEPVAMTLGWHIGDLNGVPYYYKEGGGGGYHCEMRIYPGKKIGTVIMVNETSSRCTETQSALDREFLF